MGKTRYEGSFQRHRDNPIITTKDLVYPTNSVFNAGATLKNGETIRLMRVEERRDISLNSSQKQ